MKSASLQDTFDAKRNGLNLIRLVLASLVIWCHAEVITQGINRGGVFDPLVGQAPVDGFFALSGFLIARSWLRRPDVGAFLRARIVRIFPAFWVCLLVTTLVIAPISAALAGANPWETISSGAWLGYLGANASLVITQHNVAGTPVGVPWPGDWNGSLWTLKWEFACYLGVLVLGRARLLQRPWVNWLGLAACWSVSMAVVLTHLPKVIADAGRFGLMYEVGVLIYLYRSSIRVSLRGALLAMGVVVGSAFFLPDYRLAAAGALGYALICFGVFITTSRLRLENDISYGVYIYGFPVEQLLAHTGLVGLRSFWFFLVATVFTVPLAALSWFCLEKPSQRFIRSRENLMGHARMPRVPGSDRSLESSVKTPLPAVTTGSQGQQR